MAINIVTLTTQWGKIFGGINEYNTFRGTTIYDRADDVNAEFPNAAAQRLVVDNLYDRTVQIDQGLGTMVDFYILMGQNTLALHCLQDANPPAAETADAYITKLITDMLAAAATFQQPTVTIGGATTAAATGVTTLQGAPFGNGTIIGTVINPETAVIFPFPYPEIINFVCTSDSYQTGVTEGNESFLVTSQVAVDPDVADWPIGSEINTTLTASNVADSTLITNGDFSDWGDPISNTPGTWNVSVFSPGTTLTRYSADFYSTPYCAAFNAAVINSELYQNITGLQGSTNYIVYFRYRRLTNITTGVITVALRDATGTIINNAAGSPMSSAISVTGVSGATWNLGYAVFSVPKGYADTPRLSLRLTTAMTAAETLLVDDVDIKPLVSLYESGPQVALVPGNTGWAINDTYSFTVANNNGTTSFLRNIQRLYPDNALLYNWPMANSPTVSNALIS